MVFCRRNCGFARVPYHAPIPCHMHTVLNCHHIQSCHPPVKQYIPTHHTTEFIYPFTIFYLQYESRNGKGRVVFCLCAVHCMDETGGMTTEISQRVSAAWGNWKRRSGVLCDRRMPVKLKGRFTTLWSDQLCCMVQSRGQQQGDKKHD